MAVLNRFLFVSAVIVVPGSELLVASRADARNTLTAGLESKPREPKAK
jgi:hypothetical protein